MRNSEKGNPLQRRFFCENCKNEVFPRDTYCDKCGGKIEWPDDTKRIVAHTNHVSDLSQRSRTEYEQVISVQHLVKRYGGFVAVNDISFSIKKGEIFGIIGPNGAGKTTTVECVSGLRVPDSGSISIFGFSPHKDRNEIRKFVGVQLQESALPPRIKVGEAVDLFASFYSNPLDPNDLLESLGIEKIKNASFKKLSGGQKQRLSIALALVGNPKLAILDELTTGIFTFGLLFLSGLWVQPTQVGGVLATIMYYSPSGAAARALLYSVFNQVPPYDTLVTLVVYTVIFFSFLAVRYFRWE